MANPQNMGELRMPTHRHRRQFECGEMLRMWIKYKQENGRKVLTAPPFQSFGCETAIAVASLATGMIKGKTAEEALAMKTEETGPATSPAAPMENSLRAACRGALHSALDPAAACSKPTAAEPEAGAVPRRCSIILPNLARGREDPFLNPEESLRTRPARAWRRTASSSPAPLPNRHYARMRC